MGIFATGQTYEQLILHLLAHPLPEAQRYGRMILRPCRRRSPASSRASSGPIAAARGSTTCAARARRGGRGRRGWARDAPTRATAPAARPCGCCASTATRTTCSRRCCSRRRRGEERTPRRVAALGGDERAALLRDLVGARENRRHRPGRGFEALRYRFEIVSDYGAFRDLQRHRMLTASGRRSRRSSAPRSRRRSTGRRRRRLPPRAGDLARRVRAPRRRRPARRRALRASASATGSATCST